jgi:hypothetical protein
MTIGFPFLLFNNQRFKSLSLRFRVALRLRVASSAKQGQRSKARERKNPEQRRGVGRGGFQQRGAGGEICRGITTSLRSVVITRGEPCNAK